MSAVDLKDGAEQDYLELEKFWSPLHEKAIEEGIQNFQAVFKIIQSNDESDVAADYVILTGFSSKEQLDNYNQSWANNDWLPFAQNVYKGKMSKRSVLRIMNTIGSFSNERRNYHIQVTDATISAGGDLKPGDVAFMLPMTKKTDDFENYESEVWKPIAERLILDGNHRFWALGNVYERTENAYDYMTHFAYNLANNDFNLFEYVQDQMNSSFKMQKLWEGIQSSRDMADPIYLEVISTH
jgi:hypothetical protein